MARCRAREALYHSVFRGCGTSSPVQEWTGDDNPKLTAKWDFLLRRHKVDLYLSGHDHDLQHLDFKAHSTSFVISGGGGAELVGWTTSPQARGSWGLRAPGFTDLQISKEEVVVRHISQDATVLYKFKKPVNIMERS
jgi:tartrate-resistant acid phosphatase type 5